VRRWLDQQHALGQGLELPGGRAFDVLFYLDAVTPTCGAAVSIDDAPKKPRPEGLPKILGGRDPGTTLYVGDNIDDALSARDARVPFMAMLPATTLEYRKRAAQFRELRGAGAAAEC